MGTKTFTIFSMHVSFGHRLLNWVHTFWWCAGSFLPLFLFFLNDVDAYKVFLSIYWKYWLVPFFPFPFPFPFNAVAQPQRYQQKNICLLWIPSDLPYYDDIGSWNFKLFVVFWSFFSLNRSNWFFWVILCA